MIDDVPQNEGGSSLVRNILFAALGVFAVGTIIFLFQAYSRINDLERKQALVLDGVDKVEKKIKDSDNENNIQIRVLSKQVGMTGQELAKRTAALRNESKNLEKTFDSKLAAQEEQTKQQIGLVSGEVTGVKGDVGKVKEDVNATRSDLDATKARLERAVGDITKEGEMIATTHDELEILKHKGDRNYYEFTLKKGKEPTRLSTVALQLKKVDPKKSKFTLFVLADDRKIEKRDRTINEPLQFYTGRDRHLFEVVVNTVNKDTVSGYLVTPKNIASGLQTQSKLE
ncbi:MAG TPA: hypothetical protein VNW97_07625 [Candidatus Saccharimonadales bacterium]|jgi:hypothetical protein|nr:hypothetical protein [Candidatus Saccharimonadales bacterium]